MSNKKQIPLKDYLVISDDEWAKIKNTENEMYRIWRRIKSTEDIKEVSNENIDFINRKFSSKDDKAKAGGIYYPILCEVCGKNIPKAFKRVKIQTPPFKGKLTINDMILNIRKSKKEDNTDFNRLDIKLIFWLMYSIMSSAMPKKVKSEAAEKEKMEEKKRDICFYAACMGMQAEEFSDVLNIIQYILNDTLNAKACKAGRTKFLEELCSNIVENLSDWWGKNEEDPEDIFKKYFEARRTLIYVRTLEEKEIIKYIVQIVNDHPEIAEKIYQWNTSDGFVNLQTGRRRDIGQYTLEYAIKDIYDNISGKLDNNSNIGEIYIFRTIEAGMKDAGTIAKIKILAEKIRDAHANVFLIFLARDIHIDSTLEKDFYVDTNFYYPKAWRIKEILEGFMESKSILVEQSTLDDIAYSCRGLTTQEISSALESAYITLNRRFEKNKFLQSLQDAKKQSLKKTELLELVEKASSESGIGGLSILVEWLEKKSIIINNISFAIEQKVKVPKGVLLVGMPGCGKSLCAKYAAGLFNLPLLRMEVGKLLGKFVGEAEHNFSNALLLAEAASPCVLWIDEIEKAFQNDSGGKNQSEVSARILGKLLTWMQERKALIFVIATANNVKNIPAELTGHHRFDERFFVDFPNLKEREEIITLHLEKKGITFADVRSIAKKTEGYSGAELEHIINVVTEERFINMQDKKGTGVTKQMFKEAIEETRPISETNKETIKEIKDYCEKHNIRNASKK